MDGLCRLSVVAGAGAAADVAVPAHVVVAEILPELVRMLGAPAEARLMTVAGQAVGTSTSLSDQAIHDGAVLALVGPEPLLPVIADPAEAMAHRVEADVLGWHPRLLRPVARVACALLLALAAWALAQGPAWGGAVAAAAVVVLGGAAIAAERLHHDRLVAAAAGWAAVGFAAVAAGGYAGPVAACAAAAASGVVLARVVSGAGRLLVPAAIAPLVLSGPAALVRWSPVDHGLIAALGLVVASLLSRAVPAVALSVARGDAAEARELMRALMAAVAVVLLVLAGPTAAAGPTGAGLVVAVAVQVVCRASRHRGAVEVVAGLVVGGALTLVAGGVLVVTRPDTAGLVGASAAVIAVGLGALAVLGGGTGGHPGDDPRLVLAVDRIEAVALLAIVPLLVLLGGAVPLLTALVRG